jgi:hypothetical protein
VRQVNFAGVTRQLISYKLAVPVEKGIFEVPKDYRQISPAGMRQQRPG